MALALLPVLVVVAVVAGRWAWRHQTRTLRRLGHPLRDGGVAAPGADTPEGDGAPRFGPGGMERRRAGGAGRSVHPAASSLPGPWPEAAEAIIGATGPAPVLGWRRLRLLSVVGDGKTVILACRQDGAVPGAGDATPWRLQAEDRTIVLRLGSSADAAKALDLLQRWCEEGMWLQLRPAPVRGAVELLDTEHATLRAPLAAA